MTISVWRYSHLALAVSSFLLLTLASVTGIILSFKPITEKLQPYRVAIFNEITLSQSLPVLRRTYPDITELTIDANEFVQLKGTDVNGKKINAYVDPLSGKILGTPKPESEFFQWVTTLHRSLFLHGAGRFFIGLTAFLLLLITISGTLLLIQRQRGIRRFFKPIAKEGFAQYYHVVISRWSLIPIVIIALTGTYLSLEKFEFLKSVKTAAKVDIDAIKSTPKRKPGDIAFFRTTRLSQVKSIEFPFSEDVEDYYTFKLKDREVSVNQVTGDILAEAKYPATVILTQLNLNLHTGKMSIIWAIVLAIASANILFFIYSGFAITFKRRANRTKNKFTAAESRFIILVGSENGGTFRFAQAVHQQLIKAGERSYITELNNYQLFAKAEHLIILTATYGLGDAPANATKFKSLVHKYPQQQKVNYSVLGFGSHAYPDFCKFAFEVHQLLAAQSWAVPLTDIHTVNDKSPADFNLWAEAWSQQANVSLSVLAQLNRLQQVRFERLTVLSKSTVTRADGAFNMILKPKRGTRVTSGDLLAIYPANDHRERLYSIGVIEGNIHLSVRLHQQGLGSGYLHSLKAGDTLKARVVSNKHFHFPAITREVIMISNGTGIAPFLGMISQNKLKKDIYLYCGFRERQSVELYADMLEKSKMTGRLSALNIALSREGEKQYVSDLIGRDADMVTGVLNRGGTIMICGSLAMQKDVLTQLAVICTAHGSKSLSDYQAHGRILTDCY